MSSTLISILTFIGIFFGVVLVHEFGHFIILRLFKIDVEEFGFGLPPRALVLFRQGGTDFTLNWLPLGGFVRPGGENDPNVPGGLAAARPWVRVAEFVAGPAMNLLVGILLYSLVIAQLGRPIDRVRLAEVVPGSPAEQVGLQVDDIIVRVDEQPIYTINDLHAYIYEHLDTEIVFHVERGGQALSIPVTPLTSHITATRGATGIVSAQVTEPYSTWFAAIPDTLRETGAILYEFITLPAKLIRGTIAPEQARLVGLKGMYDITALSVNRDITGQAQGEKSYYVLQLIVLLNFSLAVFNLLPFPALDGGRILFVLPELLFRKRVPHQVENYIHAVGISILLLFMLYVNVMDFVDPAQFILP